MKWPIKYCVIGGKAKNSNPAGRHTGTYRLTPGAASASKGAIDPTSTAFHDQAGCLHIV